MVVGVSPFVVATPFDVVVLAFDVVVLAFDIAGLLVDAPGPARLDDEQPTMAMIATNTRLARRRTMLSLSHAAPTIERGQ